MLITVYEHSIINIGKQRNKDKNQISYEDRELLFEINKNFQNKKNYIKNDIFKRKNFQWKDLLLLKPLLL